MKKILATISIVCGMGFMSSCSDFFDVDSTYVINADKDHLANSTDTMYSVIGILNKLQGIADRTLLLGEVRGDLVNVTDVAKSDLKDIANFKVGDDNKYNVPSDYYEVINNCNYFIAKADTAMRNNRGENVFLNEYAAVKAIRAWTYLQLVTTYGQVPFVTTPILSKEEAEKDYPMYGIQQVCEYFINQDGLEALADNENIELPNYGKINAYNDSRILMIPMNLVLADLYLWKASVNRDANDYYKAAQRYYKFITTKNGRNNTLYPTTLARAKWATSTWNVVSDSWLGLFSDISRNANSEIISVIPMDTVKTSAQYSEIRQFYNSDKADNRLVSLVPSQEMIDLSAAQSYYYYNSNTGQYTETPRGQEHYLDGDLRLAMAWSTFSAVNSQTNKEYTDQTIWKFASKDCFVPIYRRGQVYLRMAEALNGAGHPVMAYNVLARGLSYVVMNDTIDKYYEPAMADQLRKDFRFSGSYVNYNPEIQLSTRNTIGIHERGSGHAFKNPKYAMPMRKDIVVDYTKSPADIAAAKQDSIRLQKEYMQQKVDEMLVDEQALEQAFEGYRFYDLIRAAYRNNDNSYIAKKVQKRDVSGQVATDLTDQKNWFLKWNGKIGLGR